MSTAEKLDENTEVVRSIRDLQARGHLSLVNILDALGAQATEIDEQAPVATSAPQPVIITPEHREAIVKLVELLDEYHWPANRRKLSPAERRGTNAVVAVVKKIKDLTEKAEKQLREVVLNHGDVLAEESGTVDSDTPRDKGGHYLVKDEDGLRVPGQETLVWRKLTPPKTVLLPGEVHDLVEQGLLTKAEAKSVIKVREYVDEDAVLTLVARKPALAKVFAGIARLTGGSVAMTLGKNPS